MVRNGPRPAAPKSAASKDEATLYLYDIIGEDWYGGISAAQFVRELNALTVPTIHLRINSPGGDVFEARAIATAIRSHQSRIIAHVDGLAASAATYIATSAAEVEMSKGAFFMIHNAWTITYGNKEDHAKVIAVLEKLDESIAADYEKKTSKTRTEITAWMDAETWFTADEALAAGFVDRVVDGAVQPASALAACYQNAPSGLVMRPADECEYETRRRQAILAGIA
jgi:ATP-dependent protease ClpP protease subunit